ncbi:hypothetical protein PPSIR1_30514 [Plesiocystis pacifica SIR-1]|uniref:Peptidase S8/S53 domain-containing protein n=1 Tax=Plesiocystis pacifica SIR-1 TaxID=391625 RepID=A6GGQ1_9BACT|nr:S8/S53 family peptidase [Plesiocystis pacifica]EDM74951.1 hypothetical protein PPSIR1_30514 [Plesiocystis pacifica SIR-1]
MRTSQLLFPLLSATFILACAAPGGDDTGDDAGGDPEYLTCPSARVIALLEHPDGDCDLDDALPEGWRHDKMFEESSPYLEDNMSAPPTQLRRYCSYIFGGSDDVGTDADYQALFAVLDASPAVTPDTAAVDCLGRLAQANTTESEELHAAMRGAFRTNVGWLSADELGVSLDAMDPADIAVVDTVSPKYGDNPEYDPVNFHGLQMAELIKDIRCPNGAEQCRVPVRFHQAMPRVSIYDSPEYKTGGHFGSQADIAMGIYDAVASWEERQGSPDETPRLVINLSAGWEPLPDNPVDLARAPTRSVYDALRYASCKGALVFVAAGNNAEPSCPGEHTGVTVPATFEGLAAPTSSECAALGFGGEEDPARPIFTDQARPLVYAVGGVDPRDQRLANSRVDGQPALVALGANSATREAAGADALALTGTSVSTAVASGAATLLWSYRPELRPDEVAAYLYAHGWGTGEDAEVTNVDGRAEIRRVHVCAALDAACEGLDPSVCPSNLDCVASPPAEDAGMGEFFAVFDSVTAEGSSVEFDGGLSEPEAPSCSPEGASTLGRPQPEVPVCPHCNIDRDPDDTKLYMTIDPAYAGTILSAILTTLDSDGDPTLHRFEGDLIDSLNDLTVEMTVLNLAITDIEVATIDFTIDDPTAGELTQTSTVTFR